MKKRKFKYISIIMSAVLFTFTLFNCVSVKSYCEENVVTWFTNNFVDTVSAIGGAIYGVTEECWNSWMRILGLDTQEEVEHYINDNVGLTGNSSGGYDVTFTPKFVDDMQNFVKEYNGDFDTYVYGYTTDIRRYQNYFTNQSQYQAVVNFVRSKPLVFLYSDSTASFHNNTNTGNTGIGFQEFGNHCLMLSYPKETGVYCFVDGYGFNQLSNGYLNGCKPYKQNWEDFSGYSANWKTFAFNTNSDTSLSDISDINWSFPDWWNRPYENANYLYVRDWTNTSALNPFTGRSVPVTYGIKEYIIFRSADDMRNYSTGNLPYYLVPQNPNLTYANGSYNITSTQLDNSVSYGDVTSYVDSNNVSSYETVINYINNYYGSGSGGGSGGDSGGGSGGDIDWSWLGKIGEVIGGLISALGNVVAGLIDGIADLITSVTENLPNVLGSLIGWLLPFLPVEVNALLSAFILVVVIVGVIKLLRR